MTLPLKFTSTFSLLLILLLATTVFSRSVMTSPVDCTANIVSFSACLPYTALPPNNLATTASSDCCNNFSHILAAGNGSCLCSLLIDPPIFGFPLNSTRIFSLSSLCPLPSHLKNLSLFRNFTLDSFCSGVEASPPPPSPGKGHLNHSDRNELPPSSEISTTFTVDNNDSKPQTDELFFPPPSRPQPRGFDFGAPVASSVSRIKKPWSWFLSISLVF